MWEPSLDFAHYKVPGDDEIIKMEGHWVPDSTHGEETLTDLEHPSLTISASEK